MRTPRHAPLAAALLLTTVAGLAGCEKKVQEAARPGSGEASTGLLAEPAPELAEAAPVLASPAVGDGDGAPTSAALSAEPSVEAISGTAGPADSEVADSGASPSVLSTTAEPKEAIWAETAPCCGGATTSARMMVGR